MEELVKSISDPSTFFGAVFASLVAGLITGFITGRLYERYVRVNQIGQNNTAIVNSNVNSKIEK